MDRRIVPLIMCGGAGTRLWPASREVHPKQFLPLFGARSTFQDTMLRVSDAALFERPIVITNTAYRFMVLEQLAEIGLEADILLEPMRRDSGPAIAAGAAFAQTARQGCGRAGARRRSCRPRYRGFCRRLPAGAGRGRCRAHRDLRRSSPSAPRPNTAISVRARSFRARSARWRSSSRNPIRRRRPNTSRRAISGTAATSCSAPPFCSTNTASVDAASVQAVTEAVAKAGRDLGFVTLDPAAFGSAKAISIDYAVMEKTARAAVVPVACGWSDVGSWHAVWELSDKDAQGNAAQGAAVFEDSRNCNVSTDRALVALEGVDDLVVVATQDAVLVSRQKDANGLKRLVARLKNRRAAGHRGASQGASALGLPISRSTMVNVIRSSASSVKPGGRLSLQKHHHRSEHWIVVRGAARVTVNELVKIVHENESIYIPIGADHRLENPARFCWN